MKKAVSFIIILFMVSTGIFVRSYDKNQISVVFLNTGNSDCTIIKTQNHTVLIDTALEESYNAIKNKLNNMDVKKIDYLIVTHFDIDHVGNAAKIIKEYNPKIIYTTYARSKIYSSAQAGFMEALKENSNKHFVVEQPTEIVIDGAYIRIQPPESKYYELDPSNNSSLVVTLKYGNNSILFAADVEEGRIKEMLNNGIEHYDILKVPHHGILETNSLQLFQSVKPRYAVITAERKKKETYKMLKKCGAYVYSTHNGEITVKLYKNSVAISQLAF